MAQEEERVKIIFDTNASKASGDVNKLGSSIDNATNATNENNDAVAQGNTAYKTFKTQLREANQELQKQIQLTGESSHHGLVAVNGIPLFQGFRLTLGQVCFHGKGGLRQVQCFLVIAHAGSRHSSTQGRVCIRKVKKSL